VRVVHCKREPHDVYIGRPSKWGNPYSHLSGKGSVQVASREEAIACYEQMLRVQDERSQSLMDDLHEIAGKTLGCWCAPKACHGDVLVKLCRERGLIG
jgi:hypothetical protein